MCSRDSELRTEDWGIVPWLLGSQLPVDGVPFPRQLTDVLSAQPTNPPTHQTPPIQPTAYFDIYVVVNGCRCVVDFLLKRDAIQFQILNTFPRVAEQELDSGHRTRDSGSGSGKARTFLPGQLTMLSRNFTRRWFRANEFDSIVSSFLRLCAAEANCWQGWGVNPEKGMHHHRVPATTPLTSFWQPERSACWVPGQLLRGPDPGQAAPSCGAAINSSNATQPKTKDIRKGST